VNIRSVSFFVSIIVSVFGQSGILAPAAIADQPHFVLDPLEKSRDGIKSPEAFLGFQIGSRLIRYDEAILYIKYLANSSDRAVYTEYGRSNSGHALYTLIVSSPDNLVKIPEFQNDLKAIKSGNDGLISKTPMVAWMGYGIHGNELSSSDAAVMLAYRLVTGEAREFQNIRSKVITYIDPMYNPEGRERVMAHSNALKRDLSAIDPQDMAHNELWMNGRGNKYFQDLNRDAIFQMAMQSRHRVKAIRAASPQMFIDAHEMGHNETYLFAVPAEPLNPHLPESVHQSWLEIADDHGRAFDEIGRSYYSRSWNEVFYPGYYDIWPAYFGAVPILYEAAATGGLDIEKDNGEILTLHTSVSNQYRSSVANLLTAAKSKDTFLKRWMNTALGAQNTANKKSYFILPSNMYKYGEALRVLLSQGIEIKKLSKPVTVTKLRSFMNGPAVTKTLPKGTLRIDVAQPLGKLISNVMDFHIPMESDFLAEEKRNLDLGQSTQLYDVTAWSLPLAFNLETYWSDTKVKGDWQVLGAHEAVATEKVTASNYGYIYRDYSLHSTMRLLTAGAKVRVSVEPFVHEGVKFEAGTFLIRNEEQTVDVVSLLDAELQNNALELFPASRARITEGPDLGGDDFKLLHSPRIGLLGGVGVSTTAFGELWRLFDKSSRVPVTLLDVASIGFTDLSKYNVLILSEVYGGFAGSLNAGVQENISAWIESGGTMITLGNATQVASDVGLISSKPRAEMFETHPPFIIGRSADEIAADDFQGLSVTPYREPVITTPMLGTSASAFDATKGYKVGSTLETYPEWAAKASATPSQSVVASRIQSYLPHGAYVKAYMKPKHWLNYGSTPSFPALFRERDTIIAGHNAELVGRYASVDELMLSGLVWPEAAGYIAGTAYSVIEHKNKGQVISFANNPLFRGYSLGTERLLMNAVVLGNAFK